MKIKNLTNYNNSECATFSRYITDIDSDKSNESKVNSIVEAYEAFKRLKATPTELAVLFSSKCYAVSYRGCSKSFLAKKYVANENRLRENIPFRELVEKYGIRLG